MKHTSTSDGGLTRLGACLAATLMLVSSAAAEDCGLCDKEIVTNPELADCFLGQYPELAADANGAIEVDLSACEAARGVVEPLALPKLDSDVPSIKFMISRAQLDCLKRKLEEPGLVLDPSAKIQLDSCG